MDVTEPLKSGRTSLFSSAIATHHPSNEMFPKQAKHRYAKVYQSSGNYGLKYFWHRRCFKNFFLKSFLRIYLKKPQSDK